MPLCQLFWVLAFAVPSMPEIIIFGIWKSWFSRDLYTVWAVYNFRNISFKKPLISGELGENALDEAVSNLVCSQEISTRGM